MLLTHRLFSTPGPVGRPTIFVWDLPPLFITKVVLKATGSFTSLSQWSLRATLVALSSHLTKRIEHGQL